jgi:hypothetical protein
MVDVRIEQLDITVEVGGDQGDAAFAELFNRYIRRWHELQRQSEADRRFSEQERRLPAEGSALWQR